MVIKAISGKEYSSSLDGVKRNPEEISKPFSPAFRLGFMQATLNEYWHLLFWRSPKLVALLRILRTHLKNHLLESIGVSGDISLLSISGEADCGKPLSSYKSFSLKFGLGPAFLYLAARFYNIHEPCIASSSYFLANNIRHNFFFMLKKL